ncbi:MAG: hypothetical protein LBV33_08845, partial [Lachnospiraceae bacterium]|nr:hypothetical protein [Lachnospiraceae bacterium]
MMKQLFVLDPDYKPMAEKYEKKDALWAVGIYLVVILLYLSAGYLTMMTGSNISAIIINYLLLALVLIVVCMRDQKLNTVGLTFKHFKRSLMVGTTIGLAISVCVNIIPTILSGGQWLGSGGLL